MFHILLESVLPEFDHYLAIHTFSTSQWQFQSQKDYDQVLAAQLHVFISDEHH
jgi:hypothetical protein